MVGGGEGRRVACQTNAKFLLEMFTPPIVLLQVQAAWGASHSPSLMSLFLLESPLQVGCGAGGVFSVGSLC